jgi:hypothetical protein
MYKIRVEGKTIGKNREIRFSVFKNKVSIIDDESENSIAGLAIK